MALPQKNKIALLLPHLRVGGAETVMVRLANGLSNLGHDVHLISLSGDGSLSGEIVPSVTRVILKQKRTRYALPAVVSTLRALRPGSILSTLGRLNLLLAFAKPFLGDTKIVIREANTPSQELAGGDHGLLLRHLYPFVYRKLDTIVCQSNFMLDDVNAHLGVPKEKLVRIYNPAPVREIENALRNAETPYPDNERPIVFCGRLTAQKGVDTLIKAFRIVKDEIPESVLYLMGEGELRNILESNARNLGLGDSVRFLGFRRDRYKYIHFAELFVLASRWEGLPNVLIESIACGTPVVATDCQGGSREIVRTGVNGWLVPVDDESAFAGAVVDYLNGASVLNCSSIKSTLEVFDENKIVAEYEALLVT